MDLSSTVERPSFDALVVEAGLGHTVGARSARLSRLLTRARFVADAVLASYARLLLGRTRALGLGLVVATMLEPRLFIAGILGSLVAVGAARALGMSSEAIHSGQYGYNAVLVALGLASWLEPTPVSGVLFVLAIVASVMLTSAFHALVTGASGLPTLTWPFLLTFYLLVGLVPLAGLALRVPAPDPELLAAPSAIRGYLHALASLLFASRLEVGLVVFATLLHHSRIATLLSIAAFSMVRIAASVVPVLGHEGLASAVALDAMLVAIALSGVFFVPSRAAHALALASSALVVVFALGFAPLVDRVGLPLSILPFNVVLLVVLAAMRSRVADEAPKVVDFLPGSPEQNLAYHRSRIERFGAVLGVRFAAPVRGRWVCTQGVSGGITHRGAWRHALDFEVAASDGKLFANDGRRVEDYHCYGLPVVAPAPGVVVRVVDGVADNVIGRLNVEANWGNAVILRHAPGLFSCLAHLAHGSIAVREGQVVALGETLGAVGNSGRSATPHLHFQLQATHVLGAPTLPLALTDVAYAEAVDAPELLDSVHVPREGESIRNLRPDPEADELLRFPFEAAYRFSLARRGRRSEETIVGDVDLLGRSLLRSSTGDAVLHFRRTHTGFTVDDVIGDPDSVLHLLRVALSRVPFDADPSVEWVDRLPRRQLLPWWTRPFFDLAVAFGGAGSIEMRYALARRGRTWIVTGRSTTRMRDGRSLVATEVAMTREAGIVLASVRVRDCIEDLSLIPSPASRISSSHVEVTS